MADKRIYSASWLMARDGSFIQNGALLVSDGRIEAVGPLAEIREICSAELSDYPGCAILPGFVNAHTHLELTHYPSWRRKDGLDYHPNRFTDWMIQLVKIKRGLEPVDMQTSALEGVRMCLESGTTAVGDIVSIAGMEGVFKSSGLAGRLYFELLGQDKWRFENSLNQALASARQGYGCLETGLSPHSPYTISSDNLSGVRRAAAETRLPLAIHLEESPAEMELIFNSSGEFADNFYPFVGWERYLTAPQKCSSTELLDRTGVLEFCRLAIHCVHVSRGDAELLRKRGVTVVLCPRSNERLDVGRAPVALFKKLAIPLALGTDSLASNDSLSLWDEMRFALDAFPDTLSPADLLGMVTLGGASALEIAAERGSLEAGKIADFQVIAGVGEQEAELRERIIYEGTIEDVWLAGRCYASAE